MLKSDGADDLHANGRASAAGGFTAADLIALGEVHSSAIARNLWSRGQFVSNEFAHYLAIWPPKTGAEEPPALALARFKKTGTYALTIGTTVVATGKSLGDVLPALTSGFHKAGLAGRP